MFLLNLTLQEPPDLSEVGNVSPADPGVMSMIQAWSHLFVKIDHEIIFMAILPSADSRRVVVSYNWKYVHQVLVNCLVKLIQEKSVVGWTDRPDMTIAVDWDVNNQTKPKTYK